MGKGWSKMAPEEASLVDNVVLLHYSAPVPLQLFDPSLLRLGGLDVPLFQVPERQKESVGQGPLEGEAPASPPPQPGVHSPAGVR